MMPQSVHWFRLLFHRSFFLDNHAVRNILACPTLLSMALSLPLGPLPLTCTLLTNVMFLFYLKTGQKPQVLVNGYNLRGTSNSKIVGLQLNLNSSNEFLSYVFQRQLTTLHVATSLMTYPFKHYTLHFSYNTQDDDVLAQQIKFFSTLNYQVSLHIKSETYSHSETLLSNLNVYY